MEENNYTGTLEYKGIEFLFMFDGTQLSLIPPKEKREEIIWNWIHTEIEPGAFTLGETPTMEDSYLVGQCSETNRTMIFLTRVGSSIGFHNSTLYVTVVAVIESKNTRTSFCRMTLSNAELNHIHPINHAFYQEFNPAELQEEGVITIKTRGFNETTTEKKHFVFEGEDITFNFSIGWKCSVKNSNPPILLNSSIIFEFNETDDYWFLFRLWRVAEKLVQFLTFRQNGHFVESTLQVKYDDSRFQDAAMFFMTSSMDSEEDSSLEKGRYIRLALLDAKEDMLLSLIAEDRLYLRHLPKSFAEGKSIDASTFVLTSAAFEWEFGRTYPNGVIKQEKRLEAERCALQEIENAIGNTTGDAKNILKYCRKSIGFSSLEAKLIQAGKDFDSTIGPFGNHLYRLNGEEFDYNTIGKRLADQRNDFAHGNIDKEFNGPAILDLIFLRYLIYAMQLKRANVSEGSIQKAIGELFGIHLALPEKSTEGKPDLHE